MPFGGEAAASCRSVWRGNRASVSLHSLHVDALKHRWGVNGDRNSMESQCAVLVFLLQMYFCICHFIYFKQPPPPLVFTLYYFNTQGIAQRPEWAVRQHFTETIAVINIFEPGISHLITLLPPTRSRQLTYILFIVLGVQIRLSDVGTQMGCERIHRFASVWKTQCVRRCLQGQAVESLWELGFFFFAIPLWEHIQNGIHFLFKWADLDENNVCCTVCSV